MTLISYQPTAEEETRADALVLLLQSKTPAQIDAYIDANMPSLTAGERQIIKVIAKLAIWK